MVPVKAIGRLSSEALGFETFERHVHSVSNMSGVDDFLCWQQSQGLFIPPNRWHAQVQECGQFLPAKVFSHSQSLPLR